MLGKLRRNMTLLCAASTGVILLLVSFISLAVSESQLSDRSQAMFLGNLSTIAFRLQTDSVLDWAWFAQMETDGDLVIHIEDNGLPLLYGGSWIPSTDRKDLVARAQAHARESYGVDVGERPRSALQNSQAVFLVQGDNGDTYRAAVLVVRTETAHKSLTLLGDTAKERDMINRQRLIFTGMGMGSVLALLGFSWWFSGRAIRPVAESRRRQSEFIAAASHELRTPLAVIRTSAEALEYRDGDPSARFVAAIGRECQRTAKLVDDLLQLASADAARWKVDPAPVELEGVVRDCADSFAATAAANGQELRVELPARALPLVLGDENRLLQLLSILTDNAVRYCPRGGAITLKAEREGRWARLTVSDNGPGIPPEHLDHVFERFYRVDASRSKKEHYGLGLSIAAEIVSLHKGRIGLSETTGGGLTVEVELPVLR